MLYKDTPYTLGAYSKKPIWSYISLGIGGIVAILVVIFLSSRVYGIIMGPQIVVDTPTPWQEITEGWVEVSGTIKYVSSAKINGRTLVLHTDNSFQETIAVVPGYTILEITAQDRFGHENSVSIPITRDDIPIPPPEIEAEPNETENILETSEESNNLEI
ncbi:MAG: hypothetical protein K9M36_02900 [Candidatus Pacebacteria bacterium]|nr:hypothetical protein [Candidatus Paceibacterota bacterium]